MRSVCFPVSRDLSRIKRPNTQYARLHARRAVIADGGVHPIEIGIARFGGMAGGDAGAPGRNWVERVDGSREELGYAGRAELRAGDTFVVETPGGGGYGVEK